MSATVDQNTNRPPNARLFNKALILLFRLGLGGIIDNDTTGHIMVLTTRGRKTGIKRRTPVNFARDGSDAVVCMPGRGASTSWYRNLEAHHYPELWIGGEWWSGTARPITDPDAWVRAYRRILLASAAPERVLGFNPRTASENDLRLYAASQANDQLAVRITLDTRLYGAGGNGDLRWVWPVVLFAGWMLRRCWNHTHAE